jgi:hypothetical protein
VLILPASACSGLFRHRSIGVFIRESANSLGNPDRFLACKTSTPGSNPGGASNFINKFAGQLPREGVI